MLFGVKNNINGKITTIIVSADSFDEYVNILEDASSLNSDNYTSVTKTDIFDHFLDDYLSKFKHEVIIFDHNDLSSQDDFFKSSAISETTKDNGILKQKQMIEKRDHEINLVELEKHSINKKRAHLNGEEYTEEGRPKTIGEMTNLNDVDPWDRRSEEEKEEEKQKNDQLKKAQDNNEITRSSFTGGKHSVKPDSDNDDDDKVILKVEHVDRIDKGKFKNLPKHISMSMFNNSKNDNDKTEDPTNNVDDELTDEAKELLAQLEQDKLSSDDDTEIVENSDQLDKHSSVILDENTGLEIISISSFDNGKTADQLISDDIRLSSKEYGLDLSLPAIQVVHPKSTIMDAYLINIGNVMGLDPKNKSDAGIIIINSNVIIDSIVTSNINDNNSSLFIVTLLDGTINGEILFYNPPTKEFCHYILEA